MLKQIQKISSRITNIGVKSNHDSVERNRIQIANALFVFVLPLVVINTINNIIEGDPIGFILGFVWLALLGIPLLFNHLAKHQGAYFFIVVLSVIVANSGFMIFGKDVIVAPIYIMGIFACIFFFDGFNVRLGLIGFVIINYLFVQEYFLDNYPPLFPDTIKGYGRHLYFFFAVFGVSATSIRMLRANRNQIKETQKLNQQLELRNQELERFAYITSHDLKEPIRNISRFSGLIKRKTNHQDGISEYLDFINENARYLDEMVDAIQGFVEISEVDLPYQTLNIQDLVDDAKRRLSTKIQSRQVKISINAPTEIEGIAAQLVILFQHLIDNALKYNDSEKPTVEITVQELSTLYQVQIKDNGIGVAEEFNQLIFMPFKKLHHKSKYEGAGIGLSICKRIVENHNGKIWVENNMIESGSSFYFTISK